jgi:UDP-3-O-[3-hydroxymyristoyl] glucosamine N-acyltransferase
LRVKELAAWLEAPWEGEGDREIRRVAPLEDAGDEDLAFVTHGRAAKLATASRAACLLVPDDFENEASRTIIRARDPRAAVARAIPKLHPQL